MGVINYLLACFLAFNLCQLSYQSRVSDRMRIVGGEFASPDEIKYIVATLHNDKHYACGGGIIDDYWVLSAAHCFLNDQDKFGDKKLKVVAGIIDYKDVNDPDRVVVEVEKIFLPDTYSHSTYPNDIALLKLKSSLNVAKNNLQKLSLPTGERNLTGQWAVMAGFGYDEHSIVPNFRTYQWEEKFSTSGLLRKADILLYSNKDCQTLYPNDQIYDTYLCGQMVKDTRWKEYGVCNGDSGSPLVLDSREVVGVVSWSYGCDERNAPLVYTRVSSFLDFIDNAMKGNTNGMNVKTFK